MIRAFTVAHYAFLQGASSIYLAETVEQAFQISEKQQELLLAGEVGGLPIQGFDLDNSPYDIKGKVQKKDTYTSDYQWSTCNFKQFNL